jgi:hypothetical protein
MERLPISSLVDWTAKIDGVEAVFIVKDSVGKIRVVSTDGLIETIMPLLSEAASRAIVEKIDDFAGLLTGDREYFWLKPKSYSYEPNPAWAPKPTKGEE